MCRCWINESPYTIVLIIPVCVSMVLNLIFLCNILRVLLIKLRAGPRVGSSRPSSTLLQVCCYRLHLTHEFQRNDIRIICVCWTRNIHGSPLDATKFKMLIVSLNELQILIEVSSTRGRSQWPFACWDFCFEFHSCHVCLSLVSVVCCQVQISASG